jgi:hypothetical protein
MRLRRSKFFCFNCVSAGASTMLLVMFFITPASAQRWPFDLWHEGKIIMTDGDTIKSLIKYDLEKDIVQYARTEENIVVLSARKVLWFEIFDQTVKAYRQFFALPYSSGGSYRSPVFFELLAEGKITLLSREALEYRSVPVGYYGGSYSRLVLVYSYFLMNAKGDITPFTGKKHELLEMMGKNSDAVEKYIRANRLKVEEKSDFARIVAYYNSLKGS